MQCYKYNAATLQHLTPSEYCTYIAVLLIGISSCIMNVNCSSIGQNISSVIIPHYHSVKMLMK